MSKYIVADDLKMELTKWDVNGHCTNCGGHAPFYCMVSCARMDGEDGDTDGTI